MRFSNTKKMVMLRLCVAVCFILNMAQPPSLLAQSRQTNDGKRSSQEEQTKKDNQNNDLLLLSNIDNTKDKIIDIDDESKASESKTLIIKLKRGKGYQAAAQNFEKNKPVFSKVSKKSKLDVINQKHQVKEIAPVLKTNEQKIKPSSLTASKARSSEKQRLSEIKSKKKIIENKFSERTQRKNFNDNKEKADNQAPALADYFVVHFDDKKDTKSLEEIKAEYESDDAVEYAEFDTKVEIFYEPTDPYYHSVGSWGQSHDDLYALKPVRLHAGDPAQSLGAWAKSKGENIVVAVIDTGVDYNHPDMIANMWTDADGYHGYDFVNNDHDPMDDHGHGTHCAGTIAAVENNIGVIGVAPQAKIMAVKGLSATGSGYISGLAAAVIYAVDNGADVLSNSWGGGGSSQVLTDAFAYAHNMGCVSVAAAGNSNADANSFQPASLPTVITVAATDPDDAKASFSNFGNKIDIAAPGVQILSLRAEGTDMYGARNPSLLGQYVVGDIYYRANGTSMACPHAAGLAALILAKNPQFSNEDVRSAMRKSADDLGQAGFDPFFGHGRINAQEAVNLNFVCRVKMLTPFSLIRKEGYYNIYGEAAGGSHFINYALFYADSRQGPWTQITENVTPGEKIATVNPQGEIEYPLLGTLNLDIIEGSIVYLKLEVLDDTGEIWREDSELVFVDNQKTGWPQKTYGEDYDVPLYLSMSGNSISGSPVIGNIDNSSDGSLEVVIANAQGVFVFDHEGNDMPGWPKLIPPEHQNISAMPSTPSLVDLTGDGKLEIVYIGHSGYYTNINNYKYLNTTEPIAGLHVWRHTGASLEGWPQRMDGLTKIGYPFALKHLNAHTVIADIDNDGEDEIVASALINTFDNNVQRIYQPLLYAWEKDGSLVKDNNGQTSWPYLLSLKDGQITEENAYASCGCKNEIYFISGPIVADLNSDGKTEIVQPIFAQYPKDDGTKGYIASIHAVDAYGNSAQELPFPKDYENPIAPYSGTITNALTAADINNDGLIELLTSTSMGNFVILDYQGEILDLKSISGVFVESSIVPIDLDSQGNKGFVFYSRNGKLSLVDNNFQMLPGWPKLTRSNVSVLAGGMHPTTPLVADVDQDGVPDIIHSGGFSEELYFGHMYIFNLDGTIKTGWPKIFGRHPNFSDWNYTTPTLGDLDNNGTIEIVHAGPDGQVYVWDLPTTPNPQYDQWVVFQHDLKHTGVRPPSTTPPSYYPPVAIAGVPQTVNENSLVQLDGSDSYDPQQLPLTYHWTQLSGLTVSLNDNTLASPNFTAPEVNGAPLNLIFKLTVNNGFLNSYDTVNITVEDISVASEYNLIVNSGSGDGSYPEGQIVEINAEQIPEKVFSHWEGDTQQVANVNMASTTVTMPASDVTITAVYEEVLPTTYTLIVNSGSGDGSYPEGQVVEINAEQIPEKVFSHWEGDTQQVANVNMASTTVTMPASDVTITAVYEEVLPTTYTLIVNSGSGDGSYPEGQIVEINAEQIPEKVFSHWEGDTQQVANVNMASTTVTMPASDVTITAVYEEVLPTTYTLIVNSGSGDGSYPEGQVVEINAEQIPEKVFSHWEGDTQQVANVNMASTTVTMPASDVTITAVYEEVLPTTYTLIVNSGSGDGSYPEGQIVEINAEQIPEKVFSHWEGDTQQVANVNMASTTVTMPASDVTITAVYELVSNDNQQIVNLKAGWNYFAPTVQASSMQVEDLLAPLVAANNLVFAHSSAGKTYWPSQNINTITQPLSPSFGVKIKLNVAQTLVINGDPIEGDGNINLTAGTHYIGFLGTKSSAMDAVQALIDQDALAIVYDIHSDAHTGKISGSWVNTIGTFQKGKTYMFVIKNACTLNIK